MDPELVELITSVTTAVTPPSAWPVAAPAAGQTHEEWLADVARLRAEHDALALEATRRCPPLPAPRNPVELTVEYVAVEVEPGRRQSAKLYRPCSERSDRPLVLVLHGGGWWMAGGAVAFELGDPICRILACDLDAVVVNFDYRLAPEHPYPTALHDAEAAMRWLVASAGSLGGDPEARCVFGISSGANLAAALARRLRGTEFALRLQMLQVPALDLTFSSPSCAADPAWQAQGAVLRSYYVPDDTDPRDPGVSPGHLTDAAGLPPAVVVVGRFDPLRDDGAQYAETLRSSGVSCVLLEYDMTHGIATADVVRRWLREMIDHATRLLAG